MERHRTRYAIEPIATRLKVARQSKGLSQRDLSAKVGVPQSHISKIENGTVDLKLSSLIELARVLDLEITLVPRPLVPAVQSIARSSVIAPLNDDLFHQAQKELQRISDTAKALEEFHQGVKELRRISAAAEQLHRMQATGAELQKLHSVSKAIEDFKKAPETLQNLQKAANQLQRLRNLFANRPALPTVKTGAHVPAYRLDEDENGA